MPQKFGTILLLFFLFRIELASGSPSRSSIEGEYQQCLSHHNLQLDSTDSSFLRAFRRKVELMGDYRRQNQLNQAEALKGQLISEANRLTPVKPVLALRLWRALQFDHLGSLAALSIGNNHRAMARLSILNARMGSGQMIPERRVRSVVREAREQWLQFFQRNPNADLERRVVVALDYVEMSFFDMLRENTVVNRLESSQNWALVRQGTLGVLGAGGLVVALQTGGSVIAGGTAIGTALGSTTLGTLGGVAAIGSFGGAAAAAAERSYELFSEGLRRSYDLNTPFACELRRIIELEGGHDAIHIAGAAAFGGVMGTSLTAVARLSKAMANVVLFSVGAAVVVATSWEVGSALYGVYEWYHLLQHAQEFADLGYDNEARMALMEAHKAAQETGAHIVNAAIVGLLFKALIVEGEFTHAFREGIHEISKVLGLSADELGPTAKIGAKIGATASSLVGNAADETASTAQILAQKLAAIKAGIKAGVLAGTTNVGGTTGLVGAGQ